MTSVLSLTTPDFVVQVSDRQLSMGGAVWDEAANKTIVFCAADALVAIGYTGTAFVRGKPTDHWIAEQLVGDELAASMLAMGRPRTPNLGFALRRLAVALNMKTPRRWKMRGSAVVACGIQWSRRQPHRAHLTRRLVIYEAELDDPDQDFVFRPGIPRVRAHEAYAINVVGVNLPESEEVARKIMDTGADVQTAEQMLVDEVRRVSRSNPGLVGAHTMAVSLTPAEMPAKVTITFSPLSQDGWAIHQVASLEAAGTYTPWIVTPTHVSAPQILSGIEFQRFGALMVQYGGTPPGWTRQIAPGKYTLTMGSMTQRRRVPPGAADYTRPCRRCTSSSTGSLRTRGVSRAAHR